MYIIQKVIALLDRIDKKIAKPKPVKNPIDLYIENGQIPWSIGYNDYKWKSIEENINNAEILEAFATEHLPKGYGIGIDERIVEYPWIFKCLSSESNRLLDAGSTFNFKEIIKHPKVKGKDLYIYTFHPEPYNYIEQKISYIFGDLRKLPFSDNLFDEVVCHSTLEHIDMDNTIYGYNVDYNKNIEKKSYEYMYAIKELIRVLKPKGKLLITVPYGKFEHHGYFQQFDADMIYNTTDLLKGFGTYKLQFIQYKQSGWEFTEQKACNEIENYNPNTGRGKGEDGAAHSRCICCIEFIKY